MKDKSYASECYQKLREKYPYLEFFWSVYSRISNCIQSECEKIRTRKTTNTDTFHAVEMLVSFRCHTKKLLP